MYHNSGTYNCLATSAEARLSQLYCAGDLSDRDGYDFEQIKSIAKVQVWVGFIVSRTLLITYVFSQFATLLHAACFDLPSRED